MSNDDLTKLIMDDKADHEFYEEIWETLNAELEKNVEEQDFNLINDLTKTLFEMCGIEYYEEEQNKASIEHLKKATKQINSTHKMINIRWLIPITCVIILLTSNIISYSVLGMNIFSAAVRISEGSVLINYSSDYGQDSDSNFANYSDEILNICIGNGFTPLVPYYYPAAFSPTDTWGKVIDSDSKTDILFYFAHDKKKLNIQYSYVPNLDANIDFGLPSNTYQVSEETICGNKVFFIKESNTEFHVSFKIDHVVYTIYGDGLQEIEFRKILYSMFK